MALAVSGGPDSMAMLALAAAAFPGEVEAVTVDHGLRVEAAGEAALVGRYCAALGVPHATLSITVPKAASIQAAAREARYAALLDWCRTRGIGFLLTAHHADDQAETLLMRLGRGAGLAGLSGIRADRAQNGVHVIRPLLGWRRAELVTIVADVETVADPSNDDPRHDRTRARRLLGGAGGIDPLRFAASAAHLAEAEEALAWVTGEAIRSRAETLPDGGHSVDLTGLPRELRRRILARLIAESDSQVDGPALERLMESIEAGRKMSVGGLSITPGRRVKLEKAPERR